MPVSGTVQSDAGPVSYAIVPVLTADGQPGSSLVLVEHAQPGIDHAWQTVRILGLVFAPLAWAMGVHWDEALKAGYLLGVKLMLTEFIAFIQLGAVPAGEMTERTRMILTYALCGFANVGSVGITVTGMGVLMPERRTEIIGIVWKALIAGFLATCMTGALVGAMPRELFGQ